VTGCGPIPGNDGRADLAHSSGNHPDSLDLCHLQAGPHAVGQRPGAYAQCFQACRACSASWPSPAISTFRRQYHARHAAVARLADFVKAALLPDKTQKMISRSHRLLPNFMVVPPPLVLQAIRSGKPYPVRAMYVQVSNPLLTYSQSHETAEALKSLDFLAAADIFMTPTAALADVVLRRPRPSSSTIWATSAWPTAGSRPAPNCLAPGQAWPDIQILSALGQALGHGEHFWPDYHQALEEVLAPSGLTYDQFREKKILTGPKEYGQYRDGGFKTPRAKWNYFLPAWKNGLRSPARIQPGAGAQPPFSAAGHQPEECPLFSFGLSPDRSVAEEAPGTAGGDPSPDRPTPGTHHGRGSGHRHAHGRIRQQVRITEAIDPRVSISTTAGGSRRKLTRSFSAGTNPISTS